MTMSRETEQAIRHSLRTGISGERRIRELDEFTVTTHYPEQEIITDYDAIHMLMAEDDGTVD